MRKNKKFELGLTIVTGVFFVIAAVLFFIIPTIDASMGRNAADPVGYYPFNLFIDGAAALVTFNFASKFYMMVFVTGCVCVAFMLFWLIAIIAKKKPGKLVYWFIFLVMIAVTGIIASAYTLVECESVKLVNGVLLHRRVFNDLLFKYADLRVADGVAPFVFYNIIPLILGYAVCGLLVLVAIFAIITPLAGAVSLLKAKKYVEEEAVEPIEEPVEEPVEEEEEEFLTPEELERRRQEERLISYVEYEAGKEAREREYEELCRAHGIPLPQDEQPAEEEDDDEAYYRETAAQLRCLHEEPKAEEPAPEKESDEEYYARLARELRCLHEPAKKEEPKAEEPKKPAIDPEEEYRALAKDLALFRLVNASKSAKLEKYYQEIIDELAIFGNEESDRTEAAISNLKKQAAAKRAYYKKLEEELPCLRYQKDPVEPEVGNDEK